MAARMMAVRYFCHHDLPGLAGWLSGAARDSGTSVEPETLGADPQAAGLPELA